MDAKTFLVITLPLLAALPAVAATYHLAPDGDDSRTPAQAGDPGTPWRSVSKVATVTLQPGDSILLQRGGVWRDSLRIARSGTVSRPIVVAPWGAGAEPPEIRGTDSLWAPSVDGARRAKLPPGRVARAVFSGRTPVPVARFPDTGWVIATAVDGDTALTAPALAGRDWTGASIHLRTSMWTLETHRVVRSDAGRVVFDRKAIYGPPDSVRFYLTNHGAGGEDDSWHQSFSDTTLAWKGGSGSVEVSVRSVGIDLATSSHVRVEGLRIFGTGLQGVKSNGTGVQVRNCQFLSPGLLGVSFLGREGRFTDNRIEGANNGALVGYGVGHRLEGNTVRATAQARRLGPDGMGSGCCGGRAIELSGDSGTIARNDVDSTGYIGIGFRGRWTLVEENRVAHSCMTTDDCGGIYTWTGQFDAVGSEGSVIRRNVVADPVGAPSGWPHPWDAAQGIYLDDGSHDIRVDSNVVSGSASGIFFHNNRRATARGNVLFGNRVQVRLAHDGLAGPGDMFDNRIEDNLLVGLRGQGVDIQASTYQTQSVPLGSWVGNTYCSDQVLSAGCRRDDLPLWSRERIATTDPRLGPQTQRNNTFDSVRLGWSSWPTQNRMSLDSGTACGVGHCLRVAYTGDTVQRGPLVNAGAPFPTAAGQAWRLSFRARGLDRGQILTPTFRRSSGDYATLGFSAATALDTSWTFHDFLFRATADEAAARMDFHGSRKDSIYWIDDVSLRTVPESLASLPPSSRLLANGSSETSTLDPGDGSWMDPWSRGIATPARVAPWSAMVLFAFEGTATAGRRQTVLPPRIVWRSGFGWGVAGLVREATIHDARGRTLGRLVPDARGEAWWTGGRITGPAWVRAGATTLSVPLRD